MSLVLLFYSGTAAVAPEITPPGMPDTVARATMPAHAHQSFVLVPFLIVAAAFDPSAQYAEFVSYPDTVARPAYSSSQQAAASEVSPYPERTSALAAEVHPDAVRRPAFVVAAQMAYVGSSKPERTSALAVSIEPDSVYRPRYAVSEQLAATNLYPTRPRRRSRGRRVTLSPSRARPWPRPDSRRSRCTPSPSRQRS